MPNNKSQVLLILGPLNLLQAAHTEVSKLDGFEAYKPPTDIKGLQVNTTNNCWYLSEHEVNSIGTRYKTLTLPQDWDQLMTILDSLKQPKVPEYVKLGTRVGKVYSTSHTLSDSYLVYTPYGKKDEWCQGNCTPIAEEEFIQGGLKELEEAGFVVSVQYKGSEEGPALTLSNIQYTKMGNSPSAMMEVNDKGFAFVVNNTGAMQTPVGQCTLLPKAQTLPQTEEGVLYVKVKETIVLNYNGNPTLELNTGVIRHWIKLGVESITLPCGTLTQEDLTNLASL